MDRGAEAADSTFQDLLASVQEEELRRCLQAFSGPRHGQENPKGLEEKGELLLESLGALGLLTQRDPFRYGGRLFFNVVATLRGREEARPGLLVGAHYDAIWGSPGADDNASGVAVLLAAAKALSRTTPRVTVKFVGFSLEEPQGPFDGRYRHGSRHFARKARLRRERYEGVFILESVGYTDPRPGSQRIPIRVRFPVPDAGVFLGLLGSRRSRALMRRFEEETRRHVPALPIVSYLVPLRGWLLPMSRWSDHAPFWDWGYPALMLTDTAPLRNPHYHQPTDTPETLDYPFLVLVTQALIAAITSFQKS